MKRKTELIISKICFILSVVFGFIIFHTMSVATNVINNKNELLITYSLLIGISIVITISINQIKIINNKLQEIKLYGDEIVTTINKE